MRKKEHRVLCKVLCTRHFAATAQKVGMPERAIGKSDENGDRKAMEDGTDDGREMLLEGCGKNCGKIWKKM
ncbi:MAG: hypothetical protein IKP46_05435 [Bacteroidales bacterium]|nr:hypothetical protein [Bacteroidales bacterium]